ncbi:MAG TPA: flagellar hook-basal body complex protein, partial [Bacillota bacterium]|nr:flagellar hook-basal body complex protein [Bacillota bacterium]
MIRGLYTAASGLAVQWERQEAIANNLANVGTAGYKRDDLIGTTFEEHMIYAVRAGNARYIGNATGGSVDFQTVTDFTPGTLQQSDNPLDLALEGQGFFVVQTPQGERLTRNGEFTLDNAGYLVNHQGYRVLGENGPIML